MKKYIVTIPITASVTVEFEYDTTLTDKQAFNIAGEFCWNVDVEKDDDTEDSFNLFINEWEVHQNVIKNGKFCGVQDEFTVEIEESDYE
jgi:hypothetical protein